MNWRIRIAVTLAGLLALAPVPLGVPPTILKVPGDYPTIQEAVTAAGPDTIIEVKKDIYTESVSISGKTNLTLLGKGKHVIDPGPGNGAIAILNG